MKALIVSLQQLGVLGSLKGIKKTPGERDGEKPKQAA
jgi:hypothetical protein